MRLTFATEADFEEIRERLFSSEIKARRLMTLYDASPLDAVRGLIVRSRAENIVGAALFRVERDRITIQEFECDRMSIGVGRILADGLRLYAQENRLDLISFCTWGSEVTLSYLRECSYELLGFSAAEPRRADSPKLYYFRLGKATRPKSRRSIVNPVFDFGPSAVKE